MVDRQVLKNLAPNWPVWCFLPHTRSSLLQQYLMICFSRQPVTSQIILLGLFSASQSLSYTSRPSIQAPSPENHQDLSRQSETCLSFIRALITLKSSCSVTKSYLTLCHPTACSMPGFPVLHYLSEFAETHVCWVYDTIQPSHTLSPLLLLPSVFPSNRVFSSESAPHIWWPKHWSFSFSISPSNEYSGFISFRIGWFDFLAVQGLSRVFSSTTTLVIWSLITSTLLDSELFKSEDYVLFFFFFFLSTQ